MRAGDAASYGGEAFKGFTKVFKAVGGDHNLMNLALPLPHETRSSSKSLPGGLLPYGAQRGRKLPQFSLGFDFQAAVGQFLDPEGKDR
jgi:hypothetical protein